MPEKTPETTSVSELIDHLASSNPVLRQTSRRQLVEIGSPEVTRALIHELTHPDDHVRWEAAKALATLADPVAAHALMHAMEDDNSDVRWVAAEALIALGEDGLITVLSGLTRRARSFDYCKSAHHVVHHMRQRGYDEVLAPVIEALDTLEPGVAAPPAAFNALTIIRKSRGELE